MGKTAIAAVVTALIKMLPDNIVKDWIKAGITKLRELIKNTPTKIDDAIVLPLLDVLEKQLGL